MPLINKYYHSLWCRLWILSWLCKRILLIGLWVGKVSIALSCFCPSAFTRQGSDGTTWKKITYFILRLHWSTVTSISCKKDTFYHVCVLFLQISPETPLITAFHMFAEKRVSALPVVDDNGIRWDLYIFLCSYLKKLNNSIFCTLLYVVKKHLIGFEAFSLHFGVQATDESLLIPSFPGQAAHSTRWWCVKVLIGHLFPK